MYATDKWGRPRQNRINNNSTSDKWYTAWRFWESSGCSDMMYCKSKMVLRPPGEAISDTAAAQIAAIIWFGPYPLHSQINFIWFNLFPLHSFRPNRSAVHVFVIPSTSILHTVPIMQKGTNKNYTSHFPESII